VLIVDDHPLFLEAIGMLVERLDGMELAGRIGSGQEAIAVLSEDPPDRTSAANSTSAPRRSRRTSSACTRSSACPTARRPLRRACAAS
jgi:hypothetical protein